MLVDDRPRERHPQPRALGPRHGRRPTELGENSPGHSFARVLDLPQHIPFDGVAHVDDHGIALSRRPDGVVQ
jgi:hypothetical protein